MCSLLLSKKITIIIDRGHAEWAMDWLDRKDIKLYIDIFYRRLMCAVSKTVWRFLIVTNSKIIKNSLKYSVKILMWERVLQYLWPVEKYCPGNIRHANHYYFSSLSESFYMGGRGNKIEGQFWYLQSRHVNGSSSQELPQSFLYRHVWPSKSIMQTLPKSLSSGHRNVTGISIRPLQSFSCISHI
jgi:hypothetical protein